MPGAVPPGEVNGYRRPANNRRDRINFLRAAPAAGFQLNIPRAVQFAPIAPAPAGGGAPVPFGFGGGGGGAGFGAMGALGAALPAMLERTKTSPNLAAMAAQAGPANNNNENENEEEEKENNEHWGGAGGNEFRHRKTRKLLRRK
jgi:hypothetical protein